MPAPIIGKWRRFIPETGSGKPDILHLEQLEKLKDMSFAETDFLGIVRSTEGLSLGSTFN